LSDATELTPPTATKPPHNQPNSGGQLGTRLERLGVDLWLGPSDGQSRSAISEIELQAASPPA
jgi:hypothetical protein